MTLLIRFSSVSDINGLAAQQADAFSIPLSADDLKGYTDNPLYIMKTAVCDGSCAGHCLVCLIGTTAELISVTVAKEYRGKGIGEALLRDIMKTAAERGGDEMLLEVRVSNTTAVSLYKKLDFTVIARRKDFYERPQEDGFTMRAVLKD